MGTSEQALIKLMPLIKLYSLGLILGLERRSEEWIVVIIISFAIY
jgi:hypothetical protein